MADAPSRDLRRFRRLLRLYPEEYRQRYGTEMEAFFVRQREDEDGNVRFWLRLCADHFGAALTIRARERRGRTMMGGWMGELRLAARSLRRAPLYSVFTVATIALGIGATTGAFTVLDRVVLRPLPYPDSDRMVVVGSEFPHDPGSLGPLSLTQLQDLVDDPGPAEVVTGITFERRTILGLGDPERQNVKRIGEGYFELLGARPHIGRLIDDGDQEPAATPVSVIGWGLWQDRFGGAADVLNRTISIDGEIHAIVGVLARDFVQPEAVAEDASIWAPAKYGAGLTSAGAFGITGLALLPPDVRPEVMDEYVDARFAELHDFLLGGVVRDYRSHEVGEIAGRLRSALAGVVLLLVIALVNVVSLMLTRARSKERELAVRAALGAGRARLVRGLLAETALLAAIGGTMGAALAMWGVELFRSSAPVGIPRLAEVSMDGIGFAVAGGLSLAVMLLAGVAPALAASGRVLSEAARSASRATLSRRDARARGGLVLAETALAVVLVVGSGLLAKDLVRLTSEDRGFRQSGLTSMTLDLAGRHREPAAFTAFFDRLLEASRAIPGVTQVAATSLLPYDGVSTMQTLVPEGSDDESFIVTVSTSSEYFEAMSIPVVDGRLPTEAETAAGNNAIVVNEAFVRDFWPTGQPIGRTVVDPGSDDDEPIAYTVVGVVGDLRTRPGETVPAQVFFGYHSVPRARMDLVVRTAEGGPNPVAALREAVWQLEPDLPIGRVTNVEAIAAGRLDRPRFYAALFGGFALLALLLALVGVYGTTAYATRARTREIGIRLVLGAKREEVVGAVLRSTAGLLTAGVLLGLIGAGLASRALTEVLLYVTPRDVVTYAAVGLLVLATGVMAAAQPAIQSSRVDPVATLRQE